MMEKSDIFNQSEKKPSRKPELLAPAGDLEKLKYAFAYGADAVYAGLPSYSLRTKENAFTVEDIKEGVAYAHRLKKKIYLTVNIYARNHQIDDFLQMMDILVPMGADGYIMSDPGLIYLTRQRYPNISIHLSTQVNTTNKAQIEFWKSQGIDRIILARELSLHEIEDSVKSVKGIDLECFVHGAMCVAISGRCLLSDYITARGSNVGQCTQTCRWKYTLLEKPLSEREFVLEEEIRPGEYFPVTEDINGTYFSNSKDLCAIDILPDIVKTGVRSLKIEGRNKNLLYLATTVMVYREAIDSCFDGSFREKLRQFKSELETLNRRGYTLGFYQGRVNDTINYKNETYHTREFAGYVKECVNRSAENEMIEIKAKQKISIGDEVEWVTPKGIRTEKIERIISPTGEDISMVSGGIIGNPSITSKLSPEPFWILRTKNSTIKC